MARFYVMPIVGTGFGTDARRAKYWDELAAKGYRVTMMDFGPEPWCIVRLIPTPTRAHHAALVADPDVIVFPQDLTRTVGTNAAAVSAKLESIGIPADWIRTSTPYRQLLRRISKYCLVMQRSAGLASDYVTKMFSGGRTLSTTIKSLPANQRQRLSAAADSMKLDRTGLTGDSTLRDVLKKIAHQISDLDLQKFDA